MEILFGIGGGIVGAGLSQIPKANRGDALSIAAGVLCGVSVKFAIMWGPAVLLTLLLWAGMMWWRNIQLRTS